MKKLKGILLLLLGVFMMFGLACCTPSEDSGQQPPVEPQPPRKNSVAAARLAEEGGLVKVSLNADHRYFYVRVEDTGIGIPEDAKKYIFDRFYRVDKARSRETGGTGLGLAITKSAVMMHKGNIKVSGKEGEGSVFTVRIPLSFVPDYTEQ